jgi:CBS domain-containing protein
LVELEYIEVHWFLHAASDIMTINIVAARASTTAREIGTKLLLGNFNGLPVVDNNIKLIGIVTAIDIFQAIRQGKNLDSLRAIDIMTKNPMAVKQDTDINEVIDIILQRHIPLQTSQYIEYRRFAASSR